MGFLYDPSVYVVSICLSTHLSTVTSIPLKYQCWYFNCVCNILSNGILALRDIYSMSRSWFQPIGKIWVKTGNLPSRGKNKKHLKPPPSYCMRMGLTLVRIMEEHLGSNCLLRSLPAGYPHFPHWNQGTIFQDHKTHMLHVWYIYIIFTYIWLKCMVNILYMEHQGT